MTGWRVCIDDNKRSLADWGRNLLKRNSPEAANNLLIGIR